MAFDQDKPAANTSLRVSNPQILDNQEALQDAINREHIFSGTSAGTQTGDHTQGSARAFSQATAPATRIDGDGFLSTDLGSIWFDTDDNKIYTLTATLPTWTPISTELYESFLADPRVFLDTLGVDGDFEVGTGSEFTVEAATGNVATDGILDVAGAAEVVGIATLGDASTLKTAAAPTADAEIANKKYVDDNVGAANFDPTSYTGGESITFPNKMIMKTGFKAESSNPHTVTFATPFPNACDWANATERDTSEGNQANTNIDAAPTTTTLKLNININATGAYWIAIGH